MKRFWLGIGLLLAFLALGLWVTSAMDRVHEPIATLLEEASQVALSGDLPRGIELSSKAKSQWESHRNITATVADHTPLEEIDKLFAEMEIYGQEEELPHFAACCKQLSTLVRSMGEAHSLTWWSLL